MESDRIQDDVPAEVPDEVDPADPAPVGPTPLDEDTSADDSAAAGELDALLAEMPAEEGDHA